MRHKKICLKCPIIVIGIKKKDDGTKKLVFQNNSK